MSGTFGDIQIWESSATISKSTSVSQYDVCELESNNGAFTGTNRLSIATTNSYDGCWMYSSNEGFKMSPPSSSSESKSNRSLGGLPFPFPTDKMVCVAVTPYVSPPNYWNNSTRSLYIFQRKNTLSADAIKSFLCSDVDWYVRGQEISSKSAATLLKRVDVVLPCEYFATGVGRRESYTPYITGFTLYSDDKTKCDSLAIAPINNQNADDLSVSYAYSYPRRYEGSAIFDQTGLVKAVIAGNNVATVGSTIAQAMPHDAITASNTGIFATACMIAGDGTARHICRSNGLYRVYDGPKELIGEPGERISIGKHEFVYIMHSSYVFRIS